jgi:uncharacterized protein
VNAVVTGSPVIWTGRVWHERRSPAVHRFDYRMWWADLDLDHLDDTVRALRMLSDRRGHPLRVARADLHGDPEISPATAVRDLVEARTGDRPTGAVRFTGHVRTFGWCFNPIALYRCHDADGELKWIVADVTNTPWKERHQYVLPATNGVVVGHVEPKALHVSPFMEMDQHYRFDVDIDDDHLTTRIVTMADGSEPFAAGVDLRATAMTDAALLGTLVRHPLLTMRVSLGIHAQAVRLWRKRVPVQPHPRKRSAPEEVSTS